MFMDHMAEILIYVFIGVLGIIAFYGLIKTGFDVSKLNEKMEAEKKRARGRKKLTNGGIQQETAPDKMVDKLDYLEEFNKIQLKYSVYGQLIPLFPLLGLLGTVLGLFLQLGDFVKMRAAISTSMLTTLAGLIVTIALKLIDALWTSKKVNGFLLQFDLYERTYQVLRDESELENR